MSTNYVIATYAGYNIDPANSGNGRAHLLNENPHPSEYLRAHLLNINKYKHNLAQITIMKPQVTSGGRYENYYDIENIVKECTCPVEIVECENFGCSYGQWLLSYQKWGNKFNFYIFIEDDYSPASDNFDQKLLHSFLSKNCGYLASYVERDVLAANSNGMVSAKALEQVYAKYDDPRSELYKLFDGPRLQTLGHVCQQSFSLLFNNSGCGLADFTDQYSSVFYYGPNNFRNFSTVENNHIFLPLQYPNLT